MTLLQSARDPAGPRAAAKKGGTVRTLEEDLQAALAFHGHLCHGMVMGVRMARYGIRELGIEDPHTYRDLIVYVELDRCASDAVSVAAGVTLGRRRLKWMDYGKMAATFVDLATGRAVRVAPRPEVPHAGRDDDPLVMWDSWTDEQLFTCTPVNVAVPRRTAREDPSAPWSARSAEKTVQDGRDVEKDGRTLCRGAAARPTTHSEVWASPSAGGDLRSQPPFNRSSARNCRALTAPSVLPRSWATSFTERLRETAADHLFCSSVSSKMAS